MFGLTPEHDRCYFALPEAPFGVDANDDQDNSTNENDVPLDDRVYDDQLDKLGYNDTEPREPRASLGDQYDQFKKLKNRFWKRNSEKTTEAGARTATQTGAKAVSKAATQTAVKTGAKAAATVAAEGGLAVAEGATGPVGWALLAGQVLLESGKAFAHKVTTDRYFALVLAAIAIGGIVFIFILFGAISGSLCNPLNLRGARCVQAQTDVQAAAVGGRERGIVVASNLAGLDEGVKTIRTVLQKNPPKGANVAEANRILGEIDALRPSLQSNTYGAEAKNQAELLKRYQELVVELNKAIYPNKSALQSRLLDLQKAGAIAFVQGAGCQPQRDINNLALQSETFQVLVTSAEFAQSKGIRLRVSCLVTGHRLISGNKPPPRCGDRGYAGANISRHCLGLAIDFDEPYIEIRNYLRTQKAALNIEDVIDEGNHLHIELRK